MHKKNSIWGRTISIFFVAFLILYANFCFALEIEYPVLPGGGTISGQTPITSYLKYIFDFGMAIGFLATVISLIIGGIFYILSPARPNLAEKAKDRISGAAYGCLILFLLYMIITTVNPQLKIFKTTALSNIPISTPPPPPGVSFFYQNGCTNGSNTSLLGWPFYSSGLKDMNEMKNRTKSVKIVQQKETNTYFFTILFNNINYYGKCQYVSAAGCTDVKPFFSSAAIYQYSLRPTGRGVTFYRRSVYNIEGGSLFINNSEISNIYIEELEKLNFEDVPEDEQDCTKWDLKGECIEKKSPNLSKENINSIKIDGDYIVLLIYFSPYDAEDGPWSYCQIFPTIEDMNMAGPKQIKWEDIRRSGNYPNYVVIFPIAK